MNAETVKKETLTCSNCGHIIKLNAWGIPIKHQSGDYMDAINRARIKFEKINEECNEKDNQERT